MSLHTVLFFTLICQAVLNTFIQAGEEANARGWTLADVDIDSEKDIGYQSYEDDSANEMVHIDPKLLTYLSRQAKSNEKATERLEASSFQRLDCAENEAMKLRELIRVIQETFERNRHTSGSNDWEIAGHGLRQGIHLDVAFSARTNSSVKMKYNETVIFDHVLVHKGGGYDSSAGVYTVPISGAYRLSYQLATAYNFAAITELTVGDEAVSHEVTGYRREGSTTTHSMSGNELIMNMEKGDKVRLVYKGGDALINRYSTFSAFLLYVV